MNKKFKWVVEFEVDETWVADGFQLNEERAKSMIENALPYSYPSETAVKVLKAPALAKIMKTQGYSERDIKATVTA